MLKRSFKRKVNIKLSLQYKKVQTKHTFLITKNKNIKTVIANKKMQIKK